MTRQLLRSLFAALALSACAQVPEVCESCSDPWQSSEKNTLFERPEGESYDRYAAFKRKILREAKYFPPWVDAERRSARIDAVAPRKWTPEAGRCEGRAGKRGIVLVHGLFDTPFIMRDLARHFAARCLTVYEVLLTGHGTRPGDLLSVSRSAWKREVAHVVKATKGEVKELYVAGFSLGGALSIDIASRYQRVRAALVFAPALKPTNNLAYGSIVFDTLGARYFKAFEEFDYAKYESLSHNAGSETYRLGREVKEILDQGLGKPLFVAVSLEDATIDARYTLETASQAPLEPGSRVLVFAAKPDDAAPLCGRYRERQSVGSCRVVLSADRSKGIKSLSHVGLVVAPGNDHYGLEGDYRNCLYSTSQKRLCLLGEITERTCRERLICYGEAIRATKNPVIRRITFNPFFPALTGAIDEFLDELEGRADG